MDKDTAKAVSTEEYDLYATEIIQGLTNALLEDEDNKNLELLILAPILVATCFGMMKGKIFGADEKREVKHVVSNENGKVTVIGPNGKEVPDWLKDMVDEMAEHLGEEKMRS